MIRVVQMPVKHSILIFQGILKMERYVIKLATETVNKTGAMEGVLN